METLVVPVVSGKLPEEVLTGAGTRIQHPNIKVLFASLVQTHPELCFAQLLLWIDPYHHHERNHEGEDAVSHYMTYTHARQAKELEEAPKQLQAPSDIANLHGVLASGTLAGESARDA